MVPHAGRGQRASEGRYTAQAEVLWSRLAHVPFSVNVDLDKHAQCNDSRKFSYSFAESLGIVCAAGVT